MNFDSLGYFLALAREKNFTRAAETLHITQQSLSSHIANLERELNCTLVVRRTPLQLTYAGRTFLRYAESIGQTRQAMEREFSISLKIRRASCASASPTHAAAPSCRA